MSSGSYASIGVPGKYLTEEIISLIEEYADRDDDLAEPVVCFHSDSQHNGRFDSLEGELVERCIPFDRHTGQDFDVDAETRYYRPARDGEPEIDISTTENCDGEVVPVSKLKDIADLPAGRLVAALREILDEFSPKVSPLSDWNR